MADKAERVGWVKIYRSLWDSDVWEINSPFDERAAWLDLIMLANHEDGIIIEGRKKKAIKRGQHKTSIRKLSQRWHRSKDWVSRYLKLLQSLGMITYTINTNGTLLTIENYSNYQDTPDTSKDTDKDTNKDTSKDTNKSRTRRKEVKEDKKKRNIAPTSGASWEDSECE